MKAKKPIAQAKQGRPSVYSKEIADLICRALADGGSLNSICKAENMPSEATVRSWALDDVEGFSANYARAREIGYDKLAEELLEIADTPLVGTKTITKLTGVETTEGDMVEHRRLQVDTRKWMLSKMLPKRFGDRQQVDVNDVSQPSIEQVDERLAALLAKANAGRA